MNTKPTFDKFYNQFHTVVLTYIKGRFNRSQEDAEEITNDSLMKAYKNFDNYDADKGNLLRWVCSVAFQVATDHIRTDHRKHFGNLDDFDNKHQLDVVSYHSADKIVDGEETMSAIRNALHTLSENNRVVAVLRFVNGKSYKEIAEILDIPMTNVCQIVARSRKQLTALLQPLVQ